MIKVKQVRLYIACFYGNFFILRSFIPASIHVFLWRNIGRWLIITAGRSTLLQVIVYGCCLFYGSVSTAFWLRSNLSISASVGYCVGALLATVALSRERIHGCHDISAACQEHAHTVLFCMTSVFFNQLWNAKELVVFPAHTCWWGLCVWAVVNCEVLLPLCVTVVIDIPVCCIFIPD